MYGFSIHPITTWSTQTGCVIRATNEAGKRYIHKAEMYEHEAPGLLQTVCTLSVAARAATMVQWLCMWRAGTYTRMGCTRWRHAALRCLFHSLPGRDEMDANFRVRTRRHWKASGIRGHADIYRQRGEQGGGHRRG